MNVYMHEWVYERMYEYMHETCMTVYNLMKQDWSSKMGYGPTSHYKHLVIFIGDNITRDESNTVAVNPFKQSTDGVKSIFKPTDGVKPIFKPLIGDQPNNQTTVGDTTQ